MTILSSPHGPLFIQAIPRSGGTLLNLMLDSHPDLAMSYEIYDDLLTNDNGSYLSLHEAITDLSPWAVTGKSPRSQQLEGISISNLRTFTARAMRAGLTRDDVTSALTTVGEKWLDFRHIDARLDLIEVLMKMKAARKITSRWGGKTKGHLTHLYSRNPSAQFLIMYRDFRDIYSSRKSHGFDHLGDLQKQAEEWIMTLQSFTKFAAETGARSMIVDYETLCKEPRWSLERICSFLDVQFSWSMLDFDGGQLGLFENSFGHLSADQLRRGLNDQSIGRYAFDLTQDESSQIWDITRGFRPTCFVKLGE